MALFDKYYATLSLMHAIMRFLGEFETAEFRKIAIPLPLSYRETVIVSVPVPYYIIQFSIFSFLFVSLPYPY